MTYIRLIWSSLLAFSFLNMSSCVRTVDSWCKWFNSELKSVKFIIVTLMNLTKNFPFLKGGWNRTDDRPVTRHSLQILHFSIQFRSFRLKRFDLCFQHFHIDFRLGIRQFARFLFQVSLNRFEFSSAGLHTSQLRRDLTDFILVLSLWKSPEKIRRESLTE